MKTFENSKKGVTSLDLNNGTAYGTSVAKATIGAEKRSLATSDTSLLTTLTIDGAAEVGAASRAPDEPISPLSAQTRSKRINAGSSYKPTESAAAEQEAPDARDKSFSIFDAQLGAVAQLLDIVTDLQKAHESHAQIERERRKKRLHNLLEASPSFEENPLREIRSQTEHSDA